MNVKIFLTIAAVIALLFGLGFVLVPGPLTSLFGVTLDPVGTFVAQLFGAALLGLGTINWLARGLSEPRPVLIGNFVGNAFGFLVDLFGQLNHVGGINGLGWVTVLLYLFLAIGHGYYVFFAQGALRRVMR